MKEVEALIDLTITGKENKVEALIEALKNSQFGKYIDNIRVYYDM